MFQAAIFDLDGVLSNTIPYHRAAWQRIAEDFNLLLTDEHYAQLRGVTARDTLELILQWAGRFLSPAERTEKLQLKDRYFGQYVEQLNETDRLPGVPEFLDSIPSDVAIGLGSSSRSGEAVLTRLGLRSYFGAVVDANTTTRGKPDPEVFLRAAQLLGVEPARSIVFEDSPKGIVAARAGGFRTVGVGDPTTLREAEVVIPGFRFLDFRQVERLLAVHSD